jgi:hypothetical protein
VMRLRLGNYQREMEHGPAGLFAPAGERKGDVEVPPPSRPKGLYGPLVRQRGYPSFALIPI